MKSIIFKLPDGVQIPDGKEIGDTFQAMATFSIEKNGDVCLEEVDGEPLDPSKEESDEPSESANDDTSNPSVLRGLLMGGQGAPGGQ